MHFHLIFSLFKFFPPRLPVSLPEVKEGDGGGKYKFIGKIEILTKWAASLLSFCTFPAQSSLAQDLSDCGFGEVSLVIPSFSTSLPEVKEGDGGGTDEEKSGGRTHYVLHLLPQSLLVILGNIYTVTG